MKEFSQVIKLGYRYLYGTEMDGHTKAFKGISPALSTITGRGRNGIFGAVEMIEGTMGYIDKSIILTS